MVKSRTRSASVRRVVATSLLLCALALAGMLAVESTATAGEGAFRQSAVAQEPAVAEAPAATGVDAAIREEGLERSQIMQTLHYLTDRYGPRLTGSPSYKEAAEWAMHQLSAWGLENARLEEWDFGHPGWENHRLTAHIVSPVEDALVGEVLAWTPGTQGVVRAEAFILVPPDKPTAEQLDAYLEKITPAARGKIVLAGAPVSVPMVFEPRPLRLDDETARARFDPDNPEARRPYPRREEEELPEGVLTERQIGQHIDEFLVKLATPVKLTDAGMGHGKVRAFSNRSYDPDKAVATVILRNEDYGRVARLLKHGATVELEFEIANRFYPEGVTSYNVLAEIPGTDLADEIVMMAGHLDSWHAATGATDNGTGSSVMMEAARILTALGLNPRRTIRIGLWGGEEQGLLGSQAYVAKHLGSVEEPKDGFDKFVGCINYDAGTGRIRGARVFGPPAAAAVLREILAPFEDLGVMGAIDGDSRRLGGSDHTSFSNAGLPGIGMSQDPMEYFTTTWHTNLDTFERVHEDDVKASAVVVAATVYHLAMRDEMLPRFDAESMLEKPEEN